MNDRSNRADSSPRLKAGVFLGEEDKPQKKRASVIRKLSFFSNLNCKWGGGTINTVGVFQLLLHIVAAGVSRARENGRFRRNLS